MRQLSNLPQVSGQGSLSLEGSELNFNVNIYCTRQPNDLDFTASKLFVTAELNAPRTHSTDP